VFLPLGIVEPLPRPLFGAPGDLQDRQQTALA
jgi:hypothetical protein